MRRSNIFFNLVPILVYMLCAQPCRARHKIAMQDFFSFFLEITIDASEVSCMGRNNKVF